MDTPNPDISAVMRTNSDGSYAWITAFQLSLILKSLSIDLNEQNIYFGQFIDPLCVVRLKAKDGTFVSSQTHIGVIGKENSIKIHLLSDNSGYFVITMDSSVTKAIICKYLFSSPTSSTCQDITTIYLNAFGQLKLSDSQFYFVSPTTTPYNLNFLKITFGTLNANWVNSLNCTAASCSSSISESLLDSDRIKLFSFFIFEDTFKYLYFITFNQTNGDVINSRYRSTANWQFISGITKWEENLLIVSRTEFYSSLIIFKTSTNSFTILKSSGGLSLCAIDLVSGRFVVVGGMSSNGYLIKFLENSISANTDFSIDPSLSMSILAQGDSPINSISISSVLSTPSSSYTVTVSSTLATQQVSYVIISSSPSYEVGSCCGDGALNLVLSEQCDDGNTISGDGCSSSCIIEAGYTCTTLTDLNYRSYCSRNCGNGAVDSDEQCDDGNNFSGDGCDETCKEESGYKCENYSAKASYCYPYCGNGAIDSSEECDDGNNFDLDGCSCKCMIEDNYSCRKNSQEIDVCNSKYSAPTISKASFDSKSLQISIEFDQIMTKQNLTDVDLHIDITGLNSPYLILILYRN